MSHKLPISGFEWFPADLMTEEMIKNYNDIIFIDDRDDCINSVLDYIPYIDCYKFIITIR